MRYVVVAVYTAAPLAALAADNGRLVGLRDLAPYYLGITVPALVVTAVVARRRGGACADRTAACLAVAVLLAFDYWEIRRPLSTLTHDSRPSMVFLWAVLLGLALFVTWRLARRAPHLPLIMLVAGIAMLVPAVLTWANERTTKASKLASLPPTAQRLEGRSRPNVYFFMLDAYGRTDRLREQFGFDNSGFVQQLRASGFVVPPRSQTAYGFTALSVPAMLNMQYVLTQGALDYQSVGPILAGHNTVMETFRSLGYSVAVAPTELPGLKCDGSEDACIHATQTYASHLGLSPLAWAILERTPTADLMRTVAPVHVNPLSARRQFPLRVARDVAGRRLRPPVFMFAHVLLTHWPYLYLGRECRLASTRGRLGAKAYLQAIACTNANTQAAVRFILARDPGAVIVLASDHGSDVDVPGDHPVWEWSRQVVDRRYSNFVALRLPHACRGHVPDRLFTVNIFRVVVNCLTTPDMPLLRGRRYLSGPNLTVKRDLSVTN